MGRKTLAGALPPRPPLHANATIYAGSSASLSAGKPKNRTYFWSGALEALRKPAGCNRNLVYKLTPADTDESFSWVRFTYPPVAVR